MSEESDKTMLRYELDSSTKDGKILIELYRKFDDARELLSRRIMDTQDTATRQALIKLGWIPPVE